ncbi:DUF4870 domain-containing protein [Ectobacillus panaciterrae]|uniref:DUF4870 domain-containing protein n=1 Tax=Ectobacillus panaciterrae TaxID=363872 RepID=UPI00041ACFFD|nr:DUF4870 domain-containing protein [Ectobacillus panaciterrae]
MNFTEKLLAAGSYFSLLIFPFLFPLVVYFIASNETVKHHAKKAFLSHILPTVWIIGSVSFLLLMHTVETMNVVAVFVIAGFGLLNFVIIVWNIGNGIHVLAKE